MKIAFFQIRTTHTAILENKFVVLALSSWSIIIQLLAKSDGESG
jgi:hypothetical protein